MERNETPDSAVCHVDHAKRPLLTNEQIAKIKRGQDQGVAGQVMPGSEIEKRMHLKKEALKRKSLLK